MTRPSKSIIRSHWVLCLVCLIFTPPLGVVMLLVWGVKDLWYYFKHKNNSGPYIEVSPPLRFK